MGKKVINCCCYCGKAVPNGKEHTFEECRETSIIDSLVGSAGIHRQPLPEDLPLGFGNEFPDETRA